MARIRIQENAEPGTPPSGFAYIYVDQADSNPKVKIDDGTIYDLTNITTISGTPVNNQLAIWASGSGLKSDANISWDGSELSITGDIGVSGTVDGRDVAADGTKLDFITITQPVDLDQLETDVGLNNIHRSSDGSDHTFIDQDVTSGSSPTFDGSNITNLTTASDIGVAVSDEITPLTTGAAKITFRTPYAMTLTDVRASVNVAPTGSNLIVDINNSGTTILSTKISIDVGEKTSTTASTPPVISDTSLADDSEITIDIDQIGSSVSGKGLKVWLIGTKT